MTEPPDLRAHVDLCQNLQKLLDGVGLFAYTNNHLDAPPAGYVSASFSNYSTPTTPIAPSGTTRAS